MYYGHVVCKFMQIDWLNAVFLLILFMYSACLEKSTTNKWPEIRSQWPTWVGFEWSVHAMCRKRVQHHFKWAANASRHWKCYSKWCLHQRQQNTHQWVSIKPAAMSMIISYINKLNVLHTVPIGLVSVYHMSRDKDFVIISSLVMTLSSFRLSGRAWGWYKKQ